jgi:hypothetical protein
VKAITAARLARWWARLYTRGLPKAQRDARLGEIDSDVSDSLAASAGSYEILSRLARGIVDDLSWSMNHMGYSARSGIRWTVASLFTIAILAYWLTFPSESLRSYIITSAWAWVALKTVHFLAMAIFIGLRVVVDFRLIGHAFREVRIGTVISKLALPTIVTAAISILSGMAFYSADVARISLSALFKVKLILLGAALINLWYLHVFVLRNFDKLEETHNAPPLAARVCAYASMALWSTLIFISMLVPYYYSQV